jgi:hypothetical protein
MARHNLKILSEYYKQQAAGIKNFELRRLDRDFKLGDEIKLNEIAPTEILGEYRPTGNACIVRITSITTGFEGLEDGYGILGTEMIYLANVRGINSVRYSQNCTEFEYGEDD